VWASCFLPTEEGGEEEGEEGEEGERREKHLILDKYNTLYLTSHPIPHSSELKPSLSLAHAKY
jgi:hypothetical protein